MLQKVTSESVFSAAIVAMVAIMFLYEAVINLG